MDVMGNRHYFLAAVLFLAVVSAAFNAMAQERINLRYPGWALSLDRHMSFSKEAEEQTRTFSLRLSGSQLLADNGWRVPLSESMFLSLEATFTTRHINPVHPRLARPAFQAGIGVGVEF